MRYGNNATLQSLGMIDVGNYTIYVMPEEANQPLVSLGEIVDNRHIITLYPEYGTIQHETGLYTLKFPREVLSENIQTVDGTNQYITSTQSTSTALATRYRIL